MTTRRRESSPHAQGHSVKRRRVSEPTDDADGPALAFHRRIQDATCLRLFAHLAHHSAVVDQITQLTADVVAHGAAKATHAERLALSLAGINFTIAAAAELTTTTRRLSGDAIAISRDVQALVGRFLDLTGPGFDADGNLVRFQSDEHGEMTKSATELLQGKMFEGILEDIVYEEGKDYSKAWHDIVAAVPVGSNSAQIADSWHDIFSLFNPDAPSSTSAYTAGTGPRRRQGLPEEYLERTREFRAQLTKIIRCVATCQLAKMHHIDRELVSLSERSLRVRTENTENWRIHSELNRALRAAEWSLEDAEDAFPKAQDRLHDHILQLVILARGP